MTKLGPHLLGRVPSRPDPRDWRLRYFLAIPKETSTKSLLQEIIDLLKAILSALQGNTPAPAPTPAPPPPAPDPYVTWVDNEPVLDQGDTGHCVGFGGADWGNTLPVDDHFTNDDGHRLYYLCKVEDGEPGAEDGSTVRSISKVLKQQGRLNAYAFASSVDEIITFVTTQGPLIVGTNWTDDMFNPDGRGVVKPTGAVAGGHCYLLCGWDATRREFEFLNSWGDRWGISGFFYMKVEDFAQLLAADGEACAAVELPT